MAVKPIPEGFHSVTPYLIVKDPAAALEFYQQAFGAVERMRMPDQQGGIMHAEFQVGDSRVMMAGEYPDRKALSPQSLGGTPVSLCLYVENVDETFQQAVAAGATVRYPVQDQFYGDRSGTIEDPFGHTWSIATHKEDLTLEQVKERFAAMMQQGGA